jgi:hypothetical protein
MGLPAKRNEKGQILPGYTANPGGRPKDQSVFAKMIRDKSLGGKVLIDKLFDCINRTGDFKKATVYDMLRAIALLIEKGWGKTPELHLLKSEGGESDGRGVIKALLGDEPGRTAILTIEERSGLSEVHPGGDGEVGESGKVETLPAPEDTNGQTHTDSDRKD